MSELLPVKTKKLMLYYQTHPVEYSHDILKVEWWGKQQEAANALINNQKVIIRASHGCGKSHLLAGLLNHSFDCWNPGISIVSANSGAQISEVVFKELRLQRHGRPGLMPKAPELSDAVNHTCIGYTAETGTSFQGRHDAARVFIAFDEATEIKKEFWDGAIGMTVTPECRFICTLNPTDTSSEAYNQEMSGNWHVIVISALEHPNIIAGLEGLPPPFPGAVQLPWVQDRLKDWCQPIDAKDARAADIEWPPRSGEWYRPGPLFEGRVLGRYPTSGSTSIWNEAIWNASLVQQSIPEEKTTIGADIARYGDDCSSFVVRRGNCVLHHETHNGYSIVQSASLLKQLCKQFAQNGENPMKIECMIDDSGVGGGCTDIGNADGWTFCGINSAENAIQHEDYPNRRSELWFTVAERADKCELDLSRLTKDSLKLLRNQAFAPTWKMDSRGRRVVEMKADTKKRITRSPDDMDALNLSFCTYLKALSVKGAITISPSWASNSQPSWLSNKKW